MRSDDESEELPDHVRHRPPTALESPRPAVIVVPQLRSGVNLSRLVRLAGCCGIARMVVSGQTRIDAKIARDGAQTVQLSRHGALPPQYRRLKEEGFHLIGLEQTSRSKNLHEYRFPHRIALCLGHERDGMDAESLRLMDDLVEIPVYGLPYSYNIVTAATMALYEYCRQYPKG